MRVCGLETLEKDEPVLWAQPARYKGRGSGQLQSGPFIKKNLEIYQRFLAVDVYVSSIQIWKENIFTGLKSFRVHYMYGLKVSNKIFVTRWARQIFADSGSVCIHTTGGNFPIPDFLLWMSAEAAQPAGRREEIW